MEKTTIEITKITPSEGMVLTNGETFSLDFVHVGKNDSVENWHEITIEEYNSIMESESLLLEEKVGFAKQNSDEV